MCVTSYLKAHGYSLVVVSRGGPIKIGGAFVVEGLFLTIICLSGCLVLVDVVVESDLDGLTLHQIAWLLLSNSGLRHFELRNVVYLTELFLVLGML